MLEGKPSIEMQEKKANWIWSRSYVDNVAHGIYLAATDEKARNEVFNLGDVHLKEIDLIKKLKELTAWRGEIIMGSNTPELYNYEQNLLIDSSKIRELLAYTEPVSLETALERTIEYYR